jgi:1-deoxy-D-xylulose-5-phosphate reductoisomerase
MKKNIVILGSTGSIGKITLNIIRKDKKKFKIKLLSTNTNLSLVIKQAKEFNVKNIIITNLSKYNYAIKNYYKLKINFYYSFDILDKLFSEKNIFYSMVSIVGIDGLAPSLKLIRYSKNIAIVNKESIICGWSLIKKKLKNHKTRFIPVDSEHFSIFSLMNTLNYSNIDQIFITASGGPFFKFSKKKYNMLKLKKH